LLIADSKGKIFSVPYLEAAAMKGGSFFRLNPGDLIKLPFGSELFILPQRLPVGYDRLNNKFVVFGHNPFSEKEERCFGVAAFISPGFTVTHNSAYKEIGSPTLLPLFSYAAVCFYKGEFYVAGIRVDRELRQDFRSVAPGEIADNVTRFKKLLIHNRLLHHLERCGLIYNCPAAKNFFLQRYEAPLPTSPMCNADCIGCISYQPGKRCSITQPRIRFVPTPEEIAEVALFHIENVKDPVVSFGQGCEGEPLLVADTIEKAIRLIRKKTLKGMININTNASKPKTIARLFDAGLNSIRVSLNSVQENYYSRYYRPRGYGFKDVKESIKTAKRKGGYVSINYLVFPGFTDSGPEFNAFKAFVARYNIDMVQFRNLNIDPLYYRKCLKFTVDAGRLIGVRSIIASTKQEFPGLLTGYFNPSKARIRRKNKY